VTRGDYNISAKDSLLCRWVRDYGDTREPFSWLASSPAVAGSRQIQKNSFATVEYRHVISPQIVNLVRFSSLEPSKRTWNKIRTRPPRLDFFPAAVRTAV